MKKLFTIAFAMSALLFVSAPANAQNSSSRNMERRDQNDEYDRDNDDDQYDRGVVRVTPPRPKITVVIGVNGQRGYNRGYDRHNDYRRYNGHRRHNDYRRYNRYNRHDRYDRHHDRRSNHRRGY